MSWIFRSRVYRGSICLVCILLCAACYVHSVCYLHSVVACCGIYLLFVPDYTTHKFFIECLDSQASNAFKDIPRLIATVIGTVPGGPMLGPMPGMP